MPKRTVTTTREDLRMVWSNPPRGQGRSEIYVDVYRAGKLIDKRAYPRMGRDLATSASIMADQCALECKDVTGEEMDGDTSD